MKTWNVVYKTILGSLMKQSYMHKDKYVFIIREEKITKGIVTCYVEQAQAVQRYCPLLVLDYIRHVIYSC